MSDTLLNMIPVASYWIMNNLVTVFAVWIFAMVIYTVGYTKGAKLK